MGIKYKISGFLLICILAKFMFYYTLQYYNPALIPAAKWRKSSPPYPTDKSNNLFWFVQVSDLHISRYFDPARASDFERFCTDTLGAINPDLVVITGDLTDAKNKDRIGSQQYLDEWETYESILFRTKVTEKYIWLDIRGNHDAFNVIDKNDASNYYNKYSGDKGRRTSKIYHHVKPYGIYSFIPIDATLVPGPKRPFNFMGHLTKGGMQDLESWAAESYISNYTIWYGHYPSSSMTSEAIGFRNVIGQRGGVYMSGHLHESGGLAKKMHAIQPAGYLELELGDWKNNRKFRVIAVDHDMLSFSDVKHDKWPIIVITNPKDASYMIPQHEPIARMQYSSHIRFLLFHKNDIAKVNIFIDGELLPYTPHIVGDGPLWVCKWDSGAYFEYNHELKIEVIDKLSNVQTKISKFSLGNSWQAKFDFFSVFILVTNFCTIFKLLHFVVAFSCTSLTLQARYQFFQVNWGDLYNKLQLYLKDSVAFYIIMFYLVNQFTGPWVIGELIDGYIGAIFPFGLLIANKLSPEPTIYLYGVISLVLFYIPPVIYLMFSNWYRMNNTSFQQSFQKKMRYGHFAMAVHSALNLLWVRGLYKAYGAISLLLSPMWLWWYITVFYLIRRVWS